MIGWSWGAFLVYLFALCLMTLGGMIALIKYEEPVFLAPVLMGLFFFYLTWEAVCEDGKDLPPPSKQL